MFLEKSESHEDIDSYPINFSLLQVNHNSNGIFCHNKKQKRKAKKIFKKKRKERKFALYILALYLKLFMK